MREPLPPTLYLPLAQQVDAALVQERMLAILSAFLRGAGSHARRVGSVWDVLYAVSRRRRELGIRLALGATPAKVRQLVLKRAGVLVSAGVAAGVAGSLWTSSSWLRFCMAWSQSNQPSSRLP